MLFAVVLDILDYFYIFLIVTVAVSSLSVYLKPRESTRLVRLEGKLDLLLRNAGLTYDPKAAVSAAVLDALKSGGKIEAIRLYREATGAGLAEAKSFVEELLYTRKG